MSYGSPEWQSWVLPEQEAIKHIKFAYVVSSARIISRAYFLRLLCFRYEHGITTFDTANVSPV